MKEKGTFSEDKLKYRYTKSPDGELKPPRKLEPGKLVMSRRGVERFFLFALLTILGDSVMLNLGEMKPGENKFLQN